MSKRPFNLKREGIATACPKCGNTTQFIANSQQVQEDLCEVWVTCKCGHDPHSWGDKMEDVMGIIDHDTVRAAVDCWNMAIEERAKPV